MFCLWSHSWQAIKKSFFHLVIEKCLSAPFFSTLLCFGDGGRQVNIYKRVACVCARVCACMCTSCNAEPENFSWLTSSEENTWWGSGKFLWIALVVREGLSKEVTWITISNELCTQVFGDKASEGTATCKSSEVGQVWPIWGAFGWPFSWGQDLGGWARWDEVEKQPVARRYKRPDPRPEQVGLHRIRLGWFSCHQKWRIFWGEG